MSKVFVGAAKKQDAKRALQNHPVLVLFFMTGCPHCESNKPAWDEAKKKVGKDVKVMEIESSATPDDEGVSGFPTMRYVDKSGKKTETTGQKQSGDQIVQELGVTPKKGSSRRSRTVRARRRLNATRKRSLRHRSLRNNVSLI
jgi:hypothetical protein